MLENRFGRGMHKVLRITNILSDGTVDDKHVVTVDTSEYPKTDFSAYEVRNGNIVVALSGATTGKVSCNNTDCIFLLNQRTAKFVPDLNVLSERYLYHLISTKVEKMSAMAAGNGAQPNLSTKNIENLVIPVPPLQEQQRIVEILDTFATLTTDLTKGLPAEIKMRRMQYEYYRDYLFGLLETCVCISVTKGNEND